MANKSGLRSVPHQYVACRSWGHAWDFTTVDAVGGRNGEFLQGLRCLRCGTHRSVAISRRNGVRESRGYKYPEQLNPEAEPYQMPKDTGGALTAEERGQCTLEEIEARYTGTVDEIAKRRQRKPS